MACERQLLLRQPCDMAAAVLSLVVAILGMVVVDPVDVGTAEDVVVL